jgi:hypothetical protein
VSGNYPSRTACQPVLFTVETMFPTRCTVVGADRFNRRSGLLPTNAILINQPFMSWGLQEELSSTMRSVSYVISAIGMHKPGAFKREDVL